MHLFCVASFHNLLPKFILTPMLDYAVLCAAVFVQIIPPNITLHYLSSGPPENKPTRILWLCVLLASGWVIGTRKIVYVPKEA